MNNRSYLLVVLFLIITFMNVPAQDIPQLIYYQGSLTNASGNQINGTQRMSFTIYDSETGGKKLWTESHNSVRVNNGLLSAILGSQSPISIDVFAEKTRYIEIIIGSETLNPRQQITSVPFSHTTASVSGATNVFPSEGDVGIGTTNPKSKLDVNGSLSLSSTNSLPAQTNDNLYLAGNYGNSIDIGKIYVGDNTGWKFHFANRTGGKDSNLLTIRDNGHVGIGTESPANKLQVAGTIHSSTGGFKFPDGSVQTSAAGTGGGEADNLGNHTATKNINLNGHWLSGDGGNEGLFVTNGGNVGVGVNNPGSKFQVAGMIHSTTGGVKFPDGTVQSTASSGVGGDGGGWTDDGTSVRLTNSNDKVGIGISDPHSKLSVGGSGSYLTTIYGLTTESGGRAIHGVASNNGDVTNYGGYFEATGVNGYGVYGKASKSGEAGNYGGFFEANGKSGWGVVGYALNAEGNHTFGGFFKAAGTASRAVYGYASNTGNVTNYGGYFESTGKTGIGVYGRATDNGDGRNYGGYFHAHGADGRGVYGLSTGNAVGVYGSAPLTSHAGYFSGNVQVTGLLVKSAGLFQIDHPLDPENKFLNHSFVESPDMKNIYDGVVITDENGIAIVELPEWFEALNKDFRYQLTVIGEFTQAIISKEIENNMFSIKTVAPAVKVSWQVTGIRQDAFANAHRIPVEEFKSNKDRGKYLSPEAFNMPITSGIDYDEKIEQEKEKLNLNN